MTNRTANSMYLPRQRPNSFFAAKRALDLFISSLALVALAPLFVIIAVAIKADSPGPVFFCQRRRGYNQKEFRIWKFRTMTTADDGHVIIQASEGDPRITRLGRFLRRCNLDELPQLINVLRGEMSLVGPRPHALAHDGHYERTIEGYGQRLNVKPGITGWAQIHGHRGPTRTNAEMRARVAHDLYYIENWSLLLDIYILALTLVSRQAYRNAL